LEAGMNQKEKEAIIAKVFKNLTSFEHARVVDEESVATWVRECVLNVLKSKEYFSFQTSGDTLVLVHKSGKVLSVDICKVKEVAMIDLEV
jgi:G3E family GTPase